MKQDAEKIDFDIFFSGISLTNNIQCTCFSCKIPYIQYYTICENNKLLPLLVISDWLTSLGRF